MTARPAEQVTLGADRVARLAGVLADPSRVAIVLALMDGRAWTGVELARLTGLSAASVSEHVSTLVTAGLLRDEHQGRHRYARLASAEVADFVEGLVALVGEPVAPSSLRQSREARLLGSARTCYDHIAGQLGVALLDALVARGDFERGESLVLTEAGRDRLAALLGDDLAATSGRPWVRPCLDWTQRRHHLGGRLGAGLLDHALAQGWVRRGPHPRSLEVTGEGGEAMEDAFGLAWPPARDDVPA